MTEKYFLAKNGLFNLIYRSLNVIFPLISASYIARILLPDGVGHIAYAQNIVSYFTMFAALGMHAYGVREVAKSAGDQDSLNRVFSELILINTCATLLSLLMYSVAVFKWFRDDLWLYMVYGLLLVFNFFNIDWLYEGKEEYAFITLRSFVLKVISLVCLVVFVKKQSDYLKYALITCLATGGNHLLNIYRAKQIVRFTLKNLNFKRHVYPIGYLAVCTISAELYSKVDITMLGSQCSDQIVGFYSNAQKLTHLVITMATAITGVFLPRISYYYENDRVKFDEMMNFGLKIVMLISIPACFGIILVSENLMYVMFGAAFLPAAHTVRILSLLILIKSFGDLLCYQVVICTGNEKKFLVPYISAAVANIVLNAILIPSHQQDGAAVASVASEFLLNMTLFTLVSLRLIHLRISWKYLLCIGAGVIGMAISTQLVACLTANHFVALCMQVLVGAFAYFLINYVLNNEILGAVLNKIRKK